MSSFGNLNGNDVDGSEKVYFDWQIAAAEVDNNRSLINWQFGWRFITFSCRGLRQGYAEFNGVALYYNYDGGDGVHNYNGGHDHRPFMQIASGALWVYHDVNGNLPTSAYAHLVGFSGQESQGWGYWDLDQILRYSSPPTNLIISNVKQTTMTVTFTDGTGGAPITSRQLIMADNPSQTGAITVGTSNVTNVTGLTPGKTYYFWAGTYNVAGFSGWSAMATAKTVAGSYINVAGVEKLAVPYVRVGGVWKLAQPWDKSVGIWKETIN